MDSVIIFRHQLFKVSEPFITQQAEQLEKFKPIYLGRARFGSSPAGACSYALEDLPSQQPFVRKLWQVATRDPSSYLRLLEGQRPALIHAHFGVEGVYALPLARKLGVPLVTTFHGFDATTSINSLIRSGSPSWFNYTLFRQRLAKQGDLFLCVSEYIRERVIQLGFPEDRTHVHYIGIDTQSIQPRRESESHHLILHVARLVEVKGTEFLIRAFAKIASKFSECELVIVGEGPLKQHLKSLAQYLGVRDQIHFIGAQTHIEVMGMMQKASFLVLPSVTARSGAVEGLGMVLIEAAALGLPLIGTRHGGIPEIVVEEKSGFLVPERNIDILATRMSELLSDNALREKMGMEARAIVETRFDIRKQTEMLEKLYLNISA